MFQHLCDCFDRHKLHWDKLVSITTDGVPSSTGKNVGLVKKVNNKVSGMYSRRKGIPLHCIIQQESLCKSVLHVKHIVGPLVRAVNYIRSKGLYHRQFLSVLAAIESDHTHIIFCNSVRWLSLGKMLRRMWDLPKEILIFLKIKEASVDFQELMAKSEFKCDFAFTVDLMENLKELNATLQGKNVFAHEMYNAMKSFTTQLNLISHQVEEGNLIHFPVLKSIAADLKLNKYSRQPDARKNEFEKRFSDFKTLEKEFKLVTAPFSFDCAKAPNDCQMELIDMRCNSTLKETFPNVGPVDFFGRLNEVNFPHLKDFVKKMMMLFGSTYTVYVNKRCRQ